MKTSDGKICKCCIEGCGKDAEFEISEDTRTDPDNFTHTCMGHVGEMLGTTEGYPVCFSWTVTYIGEEEQ